MSVRLVHPPRPSAGDTFPAGMPAAANDDHMDDPSLWFPSSTRDYIVVSALILLLLLAAVLLTLFGAEPRDTWFALWGIAK